MCYNKREVLRRVWISEQQDRQDYVSDEKLREIIENVDDIISQMTDDQVDALM